MKRLLILAGCLALLSVGEANPFTARYDDFKVYRVHIKTEQEFNEFKIMGNHLPLRYLSELKGPGFDHDIVIEPAQQDQLEKQLKFLELDHECIIENLQKTIEEAKEKSVSREIDEMDWEQYHDLSVIYKWLQKITIQNLGNVQPYIIGFSYEKRPIKAIKISTQSGNKAIFIESNIHAIEWIGSATTTCFINNLLSSQNATMQNLLKEYDWIFVPVLNPDGYEYTRNVDHLWRKNRKPTGFYNSSGPCYGVDMNRNFDFKWGESGYNVDVPCDHWYGGSKPNSEPEVQALQRFVNSFPEDYIRMYLAFHSYGNLVLLPYGHTNDVFPPNYDQMMNIANAFADAARIKYGTEFKCGASGLLMYHVSGASKDWAYGVKKIPFTATLELRDTGEYGFLLPPKQIKEVCAEVTDGLIAMVNKAKELGIFK